MATGVASGEELATAAVDVIANQTVYVVRHAIAADRLRWDKPDELRPLTAEGEAQAERLVGLLGTEDMQRVFSSPSVRCRQTVAPLARHLGVPVEDLPQVAEGNLPRLALRALIDVDVPAVVGCTHGDILEGIVEDLLRQRVRLEGGLKFKKGSTWVLSVEKGKVTRARYLPPP